MPAQKIAQIFTTADIDQLKERSAKALFLPTESDNGLFSLPLKCLLPLREQKDLGVIRL